jgi:hypothetical protein
VFTKNICLNQGEGWGYDARPNKGAATDVLAYGYTVSNWSMTISDNTFFHSGTKGASYVMPAASIKRLRKESSIDKNHYYFPTATDVFARWANGGNGDYSDNFDQWKNPIADFEETSISLEKNSTMTAVGSGSAAQRDMLKVAATSIDFYEILRAVKAAGLYTPIEIAGETVTTTTTTEAVTPEEDEEEEEEEVEEEEFEEDEEEIEEDEEEEEETEETTTTTVADEEPVDGLDTVSPWIWVIIIVSSVVSIACFVFLYILFIRQKKASSEE